MKKINVQFAFDEEKHEALRLFMAQKSLSLDEKLIDYAEQLYQKHVPVTVREYIEKRPKPSGKA